MRKLFVKASIGAAGFVTLLLVPLQGCTNLDEVPLSAISPSHFYRSEAEVLAGLVGTYAQLRATLDDYYNVSEISTDEMVVPTRGQDWYDGGTWLDLHRKTGSGTSAAVLASVYWNAGVVTKDSGGASGINALGYNTCSGITVSGGLDACQAANNRADSIINSGVYQLADTFAKNFRADNGSSTENIFVVKFIAADQLGLNFVMRALHYNQQ